LGRLAKLNIQRLEITKPESKCAILIEKRPNAVAFSNVTFNLGTVRQWSLLDVLLWKYQRELPQVDSAQSNTGSRHVGKGKVSF